MHRGRTQIFAYAAANIWGTGHKELTTGCMETCMPLARQVRGFQSLGFQLQPMSCSGRIIAVNPIHTTKHILLILAYFEAD